MKKLTGKWCINITKENQKEIKQLIKCGAGYYIDQTIFFNESGFSWLGNYNWNADQNNICDGVEYPEIHLSDLKRILEISTEVNYEIY